MNRNSLLRRPLGFEGHFTQFPNSWARDSNIGFRAKGILVLLMSHSNGWSISLAHLAHGSPDGITAVRTAVQELEKSGYLTRTLVRNDKAQVERSEWLLTDPFELENLTSENLTSENLTSENLTSENLTLKNTNIKNTNIKNTKYKENNINNNEDKGEYDDLFEQFWAIYPRRIGKGSARTAFAKAAAKVIPETILQIAEQYAGKSDLPDLQFIPHPTTWLNQERWNDDLSASGNSNASTNAADILNRGKALQQQSERMKEIGH